MRILKFIGLLFAVGLISGVMDSILGIKAPPGEGWRHTVHNLGSTITGVVIGIYIFRTEFKTKLEEKYQTMHGLKELRMLFTAKHTSDAIESTVEEDHGNENAE